MNVEEAQQEIDKAREVRDEARKALDQQIRGALEAQQSAAALLDAYRQDPSPSIRRRWIQATEDVQGLQQRAGVAADVYEAAQGEYMRLRAQGESYTVGQIVAAYARCGIPHGALDTKTLIETLRKKS